MAPTPASPPELEQPASPFELLTTFTALAPQGFGDAMSTAPEMHRYLVGAMSWI